MTIKIPSPVTLSVNETFKKTFVFNPKISHQFSLFQHINMHMYMAFWQYISSFIIVVLPFDKDRRWRFNSLNAHMVHTGFQIEYLSFYVEPLLSSWETYKVCAIWRHCMSTNSGVPMGTNYVPLIAYLFLYCYERDLCLTFTNLTKMTS